jgi:hypothetical protein
VREREREGRGRKGRKGEGEGEGEGGRGGEESREEPREERMDYILKSNGNT